MPTVNFQEVKSRVPITEVASWLNLAVKREGNGLRAPCSGCGRGGPRALSITPNLGKFYCFGTKAHGDLIALYCHISGLDPRGGAREAAEAIANQFGIVPTGGSATVPPEPEAAAQGATATSGVTSVHGKLQFDHPNVNAWMDLDPTLAEKLGIGWRQSGMLGGRVLIPCRLEDGSPCGYIGFNPDKDPPLKKGTIVLPS